MSDEEYMGEEELRFLGSLEYEQEDMEEFVGEDEGSWDESEEEDEDGEHGNKKTSKGKRSNKIGKLVGKKMKKMGKSITGRIQKLRRRSLEGKEGVK